MPTEYKKAPKIDVQEKAQFIENRNDVLRREKEEELAKVLLAIKTNTNGSKFVAQQSFRQVNDQFKQADNKFTKLN
jgi:hypothetical protein